MNRLFIRLWGVLQEEDKESINYQIANTLVTKASSIKHTSSSSLAKLCNVSKPSISRFCKNLGYDDFYDFRAELNQYIPDRGTKYNLDGFDTNKEGDIDINWMEAYLNKIEKNISILKSSSFLKQVEELVEDIHDYNQVILMGNMQSGNTASNLHNNLHIPKNNILAITGLKGQISALNELKPNRLFIIFSVSGEYYSALFPAGEIPIQRSDSKVWMITTNPALRRVEGVDVILNCKTGSDVASSNICMELAAELIAGCYWNKYQ